MARLSVLLLAVFLCMGASQCVKLPVWGIYEEIEPGVFALSERQQVIGFSLDDFEEAGRECGGPLSLGTVREYSRFYQYLPVLNEYATSANGMPPKGSIAKYLAGNSIWTGRPTWSDVTLLPLDHVLHDGTVVRFWQYHWETGYYLPAFAGCAGSDPASQCYPTWVNVIHAPDRLDGITDWLEVGWVLANGHTCRAWWVGTILPSYDPCRRSVVSDYCLTPLTATLR
jgi:hypothetical protein